MPLSRRARSATAWTTLALAFAGVLIWTWGTWPDVQIDFGREVYGAWRLAEGDVLQRDVAWLQGPLSVHWNALLFRLCGTSLRVLFVANIAFAAALGALLFVLLRALFGTLGGFAGALAFVLVFACLQLAGVGNYNFIAPYSHELTHGVGLALAALALLAWHEHEPRRWKVHALAFVAGLVALTKAEPAFALAAALLLAAVRAHLRGRRSEERVASLQAATIALLALTPAVLMLLALTPALGLHGAAEALAAPYVNLARGDVLALPFYRRLAGTDELGANLGRMALWLVGLSAGVAVLVGVARFAPARARRPGAKERVLTLLGATLCFTLLPIPWLGTLAVLPFVCLAALVPAWRSGSLATLALFAFAAALTAKIAFACSARHYGFALAMPGTVACIAAVASHRPWEQDFWRGHGPGLRIVVLGAVVAWSGAHLAESSRWLAIKTVRVGTGADAFLADDRGTYANRALELLRTRTDAAVAVLPEGALLNVLARRRSPSRVVNFLPPELAVWGAEEVAQELVDARVRHVLTWERNLTEYGYDSLGDYAPELAQWLDGYRTVETIGDPGRAFSGRLVRLREARGLIENVILISIDTLRADRLGAFGGKRGLTPVLDQLADEGVAFPRAYAAAPWTLPSHAALFTSQWPHETGVGTYAEPGRLAPGLPTLAETLRNAGFATVGFTGGGYLSDAFGLDRGFDVFLGDLAQASMHDVVERARYWLGARDPAQPFFLFLHTWEVHQYEPTEDFRARFVRPYAGPLADEESLPLFLQQNQWQQRGATLDAADLSYARDVYDATVASADQALGRLLELLRARELLERTLVVVTSDHGEEFLEHGATGHGYTLHEENVRVPLILWHPSLVARRIARPVSLVDLAPTIARLAHAPVPATWRGHDLFEREDEPRTRFLGSAHRPFVGAIRADAKVIVSAGASPAFRGYHLATDPEERTPLALEPDFRPLLEELHESYLVGARAGAAVEADPGLEADLKALGYAGAGTPSPGAAAPALREFRALLQTLLVTGGARR